MKVTLNDLANLQNENTAVTKINQNNHTIESAFDNTLSRDGSQPNQMEADLDMNSNDILNIKTLHVEDITIGGEDVTGILERAEEAVDIATESAEEAAASAAAAAQSASDAASFAGTVASTENIDSLRNVTIGSIPDVNNFEYFIRGTTTEGDGGEGSFYWDSTSTDDDDGAITILPTGHTGAGRWKRILGNELHPAIFGVSTSSSDNTTAYNLMTERARELNLPIRFPAGTFKGVMETDAPEAYGSFGNITIIGAGQNETILQPPTGSSSNVITMRGIPHQIFRRINAATKSSTCTLTVDSVSGLYSGQLIQIYGVDGMTNLNGNVYTIGTVNTGSNTVTLLDASGTNPVDSSSFGTYTAGGSIQKMVGTSYGQGGKISELTIDGTGGTGSGLGLMGLWGFTVENVTIQNAGLYGATTSSDFLWHAFDNKKIATIYNENPLRIELTAALPSTLYDTGVPVFFQGIAGDIGDTINGNIYTVTQVDTTHVTIPVDGTALGVYAGGGAMSYTNGDYSGNFYCKFKSCTVQKNTSIGFNDGSIGSFTSGEFDQCYFIANGSDGLRIDSHAFKFTNGQVAYSGINPSQTDWNAGSIAGIRIGLKAACKNTEISGNQFDSNKTVHIEVDGGRGVNIHDNDMLYGALSKVTGVSTLKGPTQMLAIGVGSNNAIGVEVSGLQCRFDDTGTCTIASLVASQSKGVHIRGLNYDNNTGGATITVASSGWTTSGNNFINDYSISRYDGVVVVSGRLQRSTNASFCAHKNGVDQTGISPATATQVTFNTEAYDNGGLYNTGNSSWVPPAGPVRLHAVVMQDSTNTVADTALVVTIQKNATDFKTTSTAISAASSYVTGEVDCTDIANGTDAYRVTVTTAGTGSKSILGSVARTWFEGQTL